MRSDILVASAESHIRFRRERRCRQALRPSRRTEALRQRGSPSDDAEHHREVRDLLLSLRPAIRELFWSYGIPREIGTAHLRQAVEIAAILCHRLADPGRYLLDHLEARCRNYWQAVMTLEGDPEDAGEP